MRRNIILIVLLGASVLLAALMMQLISPPPAESTLYQPLEQVVPHNLPGWTVRDVPLADTQEGRTAVEDILRYDDYISRSYSRGDTEITLYIAYWKPDRMPPRLVGRHTPDRCWVQSGWICDARSRAVVLPGSDGEPLKPAETGVYSFPNRTTLHVAFWHLVGGRAYSYGPDEAAATIFATFTDLRTFGLNQRQEQFFIRLASNKPLENVWSNRAFHPLLASIEGLGVGRASP